MHVRVCVECGEEYRPEIAVCADCGGALEDRFLGEGEDDEGAPASRKKPDEPAAPAVDLSGHRPVFLSSQATALVPLAEALREAGLAFHIVEQASDASRERATFALLVRDEEAERALRTLAPLLDDEGDPHRLHAVESAYQAERGYVSCPACGATVEAGAKECAECGLGLASEGEIGEES